MNKLKKILPSPYLTTNATHQILDSLSIQVVSQICFTINLSYSSPLLITLSILIQYVNYRIPATIRSTVPLNVISKTCAFAWDDCRRCISWKSLTMINQAHSNKKGTKTPINFQLHHQAKVVSHGCFTILLSFCLLKINISFSTLTTVSQLQFDLPYHLRSSPRRRHFWWRQRREFWLPSGRSFHRLRHREAPPSTNWTDEPERVTHLKLVWFFNRTRHSIALHPHYSYVIVVWNPCAIGKKSFIVVRV